MKKFTLFFAVLLLISCGSAKNTSTINKSKDTKHVFVFVNNVSNEKISKENLNLLLDIENHNNKYVFHTEREDSVNYDLGIEIIIKEIVFFDNKNIRNDLKDNILTFNRSNLNERSDFSFRKKYMINKNCLINSEIVFLDLTTGKIIKNKSIKASKNFFRIYTIEQNNGALVDINKSKNLNNLNKIGLLRTDASIIFSSPDNNEKIIFDNDFEKLIPSNNLISEDVFIKLKKDYVKFLVNL